MSNHDHAAEISQAKALAFVRGYEVEKTRLGDASSESDFRFSLDETPFGLGAKFGEQAIKGVGFAGGKFEPSKEVVGLGLGQISAVVEFASDGGKIFHSDGGVMGFLGEDLMTFVLSHGPPAGVFSNRNEGGAGGFGSTEFGLDGDELIFFLASGIALVAGDTLESPDGGKGWGGRTCGVDG